MPGSNSRSNVSEGYEVPLSYRGDQLRTSRRRPMSVHSYTRPLELLKSFKYQLLLHWSFKHSILLLNIREPTRTISLYQEIVLVQKKGLDASRFFFKYPYRCDFQYPPSDGGPHARARTYYAPSTLDFTVH